MDDLLDSVWCSADAEEKSYNYKKKKISINQLNYNAHEKSHVTEEFAGTTTKQ